MKGKIFAESSNVYQDQARILFNYYQQMAEKIVQEEERIEKEIATLEGDKLILDQDLSKAVLWKWLLCILIIPYIIFLLKEKGIIKQIDALNERIVEFKKLHTEIFRDYKVSKLGVAYVPIAEQIKYENKSFMVDHTGLVEESEVKLQLSKQNDLLIEKIADLEKLSAEAPLVESSNDIEEIDTEQYSRSMQQLNQHDYFGNLERSLRTISYCMDDLDVTSVSLPLVANNSSYVDFIKEYSTSEIPDGAPTIEVFDTQKYIDDIAKFQELNKLKDSLSRHSAQFEDVLKGLMVTMANSVQAISALKVASTNKIVFESNKVLYKILKSPYNHYSPTLEASEIERIRNESFNYGDSVQDYVPFQLKESSRTKYNLLSDSWVAEDGSSTNFPFGIHQIHEEIVAPMVQNLMNETRIERLKIYNHIKDQKISYLNKWHQDTEDFYGRNRAESADLINLMRASLRDYVAAYNTMASLKKTEDSMSQSDGSLDSTVVTASSNEAEVFQAFEIQSKEFQNVQMEFENYMERLKEDIDIKAEKFEHIDYYDALLRDGNSRDTAVAAGELHELDERRKPLISVNALFAKNSEMPPVPSVEDIIYEHMSLNLPVIAKNALRELDEDLISTEITKEETVISDEFVGSGSVNENENQTEIAINEVIVKETDLIVEKSENQESPNQIVANDEVDVINEDEEVEFLDEDEEENQNEDVISDYSKEYLEKLPDSELKTILEKLGFEPMDNFIRTEAIDAIIEEQEENEVQDEDEDEGNTQELTDQNMCPNCNTSNGPEYQFCINCGNPLPKS
ncbi:MAG: zinc ribbon domain-containing protein [Bacteroidales bacterium]|nr:zinc ribbon domain-containing protein [Bacteroidales bacterium]